MTRILITGAGGALGTYLLHHLLQKQAHQNLTLAIVSRKVSTSPHYQTFVGNFLDDEFIDHILKEFRPEHIIHLAWETAHRKYWTDPVNTHWADSSVRFAERFCETGGRFFSFAGTCAEYTWGDELLVEDETSEVPNTLYGQEKLRTTRQLLLMQEEGRLSVNCSRLFFPFSELENPDRITSLAVRTFMKDEPLHLRSGDVFRDFCHTRHVAAAIAGMNLKQVPGLFNVVSGIPVHLGRFIQKIAECFGRPELVSWDDWDGLKMVGTEPRYLVGSAEKLGAYIPVISNPFQDIESFVYESRKRFNNTA